ncbi:MAG: PilZ domain-containing protein [Candidatus Omnitrophota bacterium]
MVIKMESEYTGIERRRSPRVKTWLKAKLFGKNCRRFLPVINLSYHGALLKSRRFLRPDEELDLSIELPVSWNSINLKARVARVNAVCSMWGFSTFYVGIEFLNLIPAQKETLAESIVTLMKAA